MFIRMTNVPPEVIETVIQQPSPHLNTPASPHQPYNSDPPTSGPHVEQLPNWGIASAPVPEEMQVSGLEDGAVIISYQPDLDTISVAKLQTIVADYPEKVILTPDADLTNPIVLTAWTHLQRLRQYNGTSIRRFIDTYRGGNHNPASQP